MALYNVDATRNGKIVGVVTVDTIGRDRAKEKGKKELTKKGIAFQDVVVKSMPKTRYIWLNNRRIDV